MLPVHVFVIILFRSSKVPRIIPPIVIKQDFVLALIIISAKLLEAMI